MTNAIQLYSLGTPNGQKISIALEEMEIPYEAHKINILEGDQFKEEFVKISPNSKIPAIVDPVGDNGQPLSLMESGAILIYLAEKSGKFLSQNSTDRMKTIQWLMWQMGGAGPMFGQFGHFSRYAKTDSDLTYSIERYQTESIRLLMVLDKQLSGHSFVVGENISIADFAIFPWVECLDHFYKATEALKLNSFENVKGWRMRMSERPLVKKGMGVLSVE